MDFEGLQDFIRHKMRMTHIYQPIVIKTLLESDNMATAEDIARAFLNEDEAQLEYYVRIAKRWPLITLRNHGIIGYERGGRNGIFTLLLEDITPEQKARLVELCDLRREEYIENALRLPWFNRRGRRRHIPGKLRFDVLAKSGGVCVACGISSRKRAIEVDHIVPVNMGGTSDLSNLQALCYKCNAQKQDRDDTDFVMVQNRLKYRNPECFLCMSSGRISENGMAFAMRDANPVTRLHSVVMPIRHTGTFFDLIPAEKASCLDLIDSVKSEIQGRDRTVTGFNVGFDSGSAAGQVEAHCLIHVIPRRHGDHGRSAGGIRSVLNLE